VGLLRTGPAEQGQKKPQDKLAVSERQ
jgi:hypothetical protein